MWVRATIFFLTLWKSNIEKWEGHGGGKKTRLNAGMTLTFICLLELLKVIFIPRVIFIWWEWQYFQFLCSKLFTLWDLNIIFGTTLVFHALKKYQYCKFTLLKLITPRTFFCRRNRYLAILQCTIFLNVSLLYNSLIISYIFVWIKATLSLK